METLASEVEPNCTKLDLERFYQDLPKYMPFLSVSAREHWDQFQSNNLTTLASSDSLKWSLPDLYRAAIRSAQQSSRGSYTFSEDTSAILQKETGVPKPVSYYIVYKGPECTISMSDAQSIGNLLAALLVMVLFCL